MVVASTNNTFYRMTSISKYKHRMLFLTLVNYAMNKAVVYNATYFISKETQTVN